MGMESTNLIISNNKISKRKVKRIFKVSNNKKYGCCCGYLDEILNTEVIIGGKFVYKIDTRKVLLTDYIKPYHFMKCSIIERPDEWAKTFITVIDNKSLSKVKTYNESPRELVMYTREENNIKLLNEWSELIGLDLEDLKEIINKFF